ncbi:response regulator transcription factor [Allomuricauda sp. M10]|uniref:response regulator transcription factor n=1 Tax=Allomuricauda sp. M10 TaxID=2683292 RepID=UPI001D191C7B|nr:response regulator [Muricauda sp. M10]
MKKILIVDDEPNIVMSLEYAFKKKDFGVFIARDGTEALEIAEREIPDLILLDVMMPQMDGYETLKRIRENEKLSQTKVVFLSAKSKEKDIEKGLEMGADGYMTKPFSIKKIISDVEEMIT